MFKRIHQKLGTAGFIIAIAALVAALGGTAFAAAKLNGGQKKEVEKIAKKFAGKDGAPGAAGTNGKDGAVGAGGKEGPKGSEGAAGKSVNVTAIAAGGTKCGGLAGAEVKKEGAASGAEVCNGEDGQTGHEDQPAAELEAVAVKVQTKARPRLRKCRFGAH